MSAPACDRCGHSREYHIHKMAITGRKCNEDCPGIVPNTTGHNQFKKCIFPCEYEGCGCPNAVKEGTSMSEQYDKFEVGDELEVVDSNWQQIMKGRIVEISLVSEEQSLFGPVTIVKGQKVPIKDKLGGETVGEAVLQYDDNKLEVIAYIDENSSVGRVLKPDIPKYSIYTADAMHDDENKEK